MVLLSDHEMLEEKVMEVLHRCFCCRVVMGHVVFETAWRGRMQAITFGLMYVLLCFATIWHIQVFGGTAIILAVGCRRKRETSI